MSKKFFAPISMGEQMSFWVDPETQEVMEDLWDYDEWGRDAPRWTALSTRERAELFLPAAVFKEFEKTL